jgi:hypothetical protein
MAKGWTEERRRKQSETIMRWKPWEKSTGPKTEAGKKEVALNALKDGHYAKNVRELRLAFRLNAAFLKHFEYFAAQERELEEKLRRKRARGKNKLYKNEEKSGR